MSSDSLKNFIYKLFTYKLYVCVCVCKQDLVLNNPQGLICHKTQPNQNPLEVSGCSL